ncbi:MAG: DUF692 domain-containing protein [Pseudomonadota bacterium]|nr:DUF692 domain-containing protein [Pseudomonadota bacterium]
MPLPTGAGIGLKPAHYAALRADPDPPAFVEIHAENHLGEGGPNARMLAWVREHAALSIHGVGLSIGAPGGLDAAHLERIAGLVERWQPDAFSEHLAWSSHQGRYFNDLLPLPLTTTTLQSVCAHVDRIQQRLQRRMLLENPATYLEFADSDWEEAGFIAEIVRRTGCGLLLDLGNVVVSCVNHGRDPDAYLERLPLAAVGEIHLAGHAPDQDCDGSLLLIDSHDRAVSTATWGLYAAILDRLGPIPTLIEWDSQLPSYAILRAEAAKAGRQLVAGAAAP